MVLVGLGLAASLFTIFGGLLALRLQRFATPLMSLSAGILLGIVFFDLLPEAISMRANASERSVFLFYMIGFLTYLLISSLASAFHGKAATITAWLPPSLLVAHSVADGIGIGLAFQINDHLGWAVAIAVLSHDFADGINIVALSRTTAVQRPPIAWLLVDAAAPAIGIVMSMQLIVNSQAIGFVLAIIAGALTFVATTEFIPRLKGTIAPERWLPLFIGGLALTLWTSSIG